MKVVASPSATEFVRARGGDSQEAVAHLKGQFAADIVAYDKVHAEILQMADMLSAGIIERFPHDF